MKYLFVMMLSAIVLFSCKSKNNGWPKAEKDVYTTTCEKGASAAMEPEKAKSYCSCMLVKLEAKYSSASDAEKMDMATMSEWAKDCLK